jgi:uncharacterized membrane protein
MVPGNPVTQAVRAPGKGWYVLAGVVALAGFLAAAGVIASLVFQYDEGVQFLAPGSKTLDLPKRRQVVWNDHVTVFEGRSYDSSKNLPDGTQILVTDASGAAVELRRTSGSIRGGNTERVAVLEFDVTRPGRHEITVRGNFPPRVFSVGPNLVWLLLCSIFGAIGLVLLGTGAGVAIAAWAFIRREQAREAAAGGGARAPAAADAREASLRRLTTVVYALQIVSFLLGFTLIIGVIINYIQRDEVAGTWLESHFRWQIRTFWYSLLWLGVGLATLIVVVGFFILMGAALWLLYRAIKGWLSLEEGKAMYAP